MAGGACSSGMVCFHPLTAYKGPGGAVYFDPLKGYRDRPIDLACGQCQGCRLERSRQWALRCVHEAQMHERNCFITLTYKPECIPAGGSLCLEDWQKFAKRLRKRCGAFRFFHCGEYGDANMRPHYHACIFGLDFSGDRRVWKSERGNTLYRSDLLDRTWGLGFASVGSLTFKSAAYVARYVMKKATGEFAIRKYERVDEETGEVYLIRPEYVTMSRRPGIGSKWFEKFKSDVYPADEVVHEGKRYRPPRFYDDKLGAVELDEYKVRRRRALGNHVKDLTPDRLRVREELARISAAFLERKL